ncbi:DUF402 domain-containing protein [Actinomadura harenae]|uniref:DUF402 domain-containing protein n=1 Tax=Actinomadura harenae TaxID=2483351 RepID=A0A3M2LW67_9ACTN|nr:DUF402 domain-containing protein [Actinomadura harenae]RMI41627.1 DUF402 domain-containing protein [Actinomadura harenae]
MRRYQPGDTVVRRDVFRGRVWSAHALRVIEDTEHALVTGSCPGADVVAATTWIDWLLTGDTARRDQAVPHLAAGEWELAPWTWRDTVLLMWNPLGEWFSVNAFFDPSDDHRLINWYVNFERPAHRAPTGFDTFDLLLDLVIAPDLSTWRWKDEDEYAHGRRVGVIDDDAHRAVDKARDRAVAMIEQREGPFAPDSPWRHWHWNPAWPAPALPPMWSTAAGCDSGA